MLDIEELIHLSDVPSHLPVSPRTGRPLHIETIRRWVCTGAVDGIQLECVRLPGGTFTSVQAIDRFVRKVDKALAVPA